MESYQYQYHCHRQGTGMDETTNSGKLTAQIYYDGTYLSSRGHDGVARYALIGEVSSFQG